MLGPRATSMVNLSFDLRTESKLKRLIFSAAMIATILLPQSDVAARVSERDLAIACEHVVRRGDGLSYSAYHAGLCEGYLDSFINYVRLQSWRGAKYSDFCMPPSKTWHDLIKIALLLEKDNPDIYERRAWFGLYHATADEFPCD